MEALINEYCTMGAYDDAKRVFDMIQGACNGQCLRAILFACARAHPAPRWEEVGPLIRIQLHLIPSSSLKIPPYVCYSIFRLFQFYIAAI